MVAQTNDTDHHAHVRKRFIELQTILMIKKALPLGGGIVDRTPDDNVDIMIEVMPAEIFMCKQVNGTITRARP